MSSFMGGTFMKLPTDMMVILQESATKKKHVASRLCCTLGPSSSDLQTVCDLLLSGMKMARFDFTWGTIESHQETLDVLREAMKRTQTYCAVLFEAMGREIVVLNRPKEGIQLQQGQTVILTCDKTVQACSTVLPVSMLSTFEGQGLNVGTSILIAQYLFTGSDTSSAYLTVEKVAGISCVCRVNNTCKLEGVQLTVHMTDLSLSNMPALTDEDVKNISTWGKKNQIDFVSVPFVHTGKDIEECRKVLQDCGLTSTQIMAKIEGVEGLRHAEEIIQAADAILFSRGNLGVCLDAEKVFLAQKRMLRACNLAGKPVYVTRVVDTMAEAPRPTRAEATDVANLVIDGADGIVLAAETFRGKYPVLTASTVCDICRQAEEAFDATGFYQSSMEALGLYKLAPVIQKAEALASSAVRLAEKSGATLMIVFTVTGRTARLLAKYKPRQPILAVVCPTPITATFSGMRLSKSQATLPRASSTECFAFQGYGSTVLRQCLTYRGVIPIMPAEDLAGSVELLAYAIGYASSQGLVMAGERVVISQCPREYSGNVLSEAGVVSLVQA
ncbi:hypothetical protein CEUSTIGMA_g8800.t1 [Chlamydomonas eustigma]|uniref:Pyruvate kinase n=1 Tax=Chlamydomonas eustigma TaxID=1157962 RepID=A0A250XEL7_9CHLO|nr:hypothetical protein CEUSTIGMA_g8800.t1 [Chlamydomonas eustigma]|eukprot:GAX81369.1 hypothetical protein CEUSTIGMA_g8800.t1 [Chlamydomonas eustigma]